MQRVPVILTILLTTAMVALLTMGAAPGQGFPPLPQTFSGAVTVQGAAAPAGLNLVACVAGCDSYSASITTGEGGSYRGLVVGPPNEDFLGEEITFWIVTEVGQIQATETRVYQIPTDNADFTPTQDLTFTDAVPQAAPTPVPTPAPTPALPIPGDPAVTQLPALALAAGVAALVLGGTALYLTGRRRKAL